MLMNFILFSCQKATFLIEKSYDKPLSFLAKLQLRMHLKICKKCSEYQKQSLVIENALKYNAIDISNPSHFKLSDTSKIRIQQAIVGNLKQ